MNTALGAIRLRLLHDGSPNATAWVEDIARTDGCGNGCTIYRAEPVPAGWGVGGSYGPPYALLQGSFKRQPGKKERARLQKETGCVLQRGSVIIIDQEDKTDSLSARNHDEPVPQNPASRNAVIGELKMHL